MNWHSFAGLFFAQDIRPQRFGSRIIFVAFWFVVLIIQATYSANLANNQD
jgi:Ligand-gated ion channel